MQSEPLKQETLNTPDKSNTDDLNKKSSNEDLKKLIETLKAKVNSSKTSSEKKVPPAPKAKWDRSISKHWSPKPAYTVLTRVSNHEKVPLQSNKSQEVTMKNLPHSFIYKPGADGIKLDKIEVKAGKFLSLG